MLDFGVTASHSNRVAFADRNILDAMTTYSIAFFLQPRAASWTSNRGLVTKSAGISGTSGWEIRTFQSTGNKLNVAHGTGSGKTAAGASTTALTSGTTYSVVITWDGANIAYYIDGSADGTPAMTATITANANDIEIGNEDTVSEGAQAALGHIMIWPNYVLTSPEIAQYHAGVSVPALPQLELWHRGIEIPGVDRIRNETPTSSGVVLLGDTIDGYFADDQTLSAWRRLASHRLLRRATEEQIYQLEVPLEFLSLELMDMLNVSHDSIPLSATRLSSLDGQLTELWRRYIARVVGLTINPLRRTVTLRFKDHESFGCTFWSSDRLLDGTNSRFSGLARVDNGGTYTTSRSSKAYLVQDNNVKLEVTQNTEGAFYATTGSFQEKINHIGLLCEDSTDNPILNSAANGTFTSWTQQANGGTLGTATARLAFPSSVTDRSWTFSRANNSNNTYITQSFSVLSADGYRRFYCTKSEEDANTVVSLLIQRSTDSFYWNDSTGAWQASGVWVNFSNGYDAVNSLSIISREKTKAIPITNNETWTVGVGLEGASLPAGGGEANVYSLSCLKDYLVYSEVPTDTASVTTDDDTLKLVRSSLPQVVSATRGTVTFDVVAIQDGSDLADGDELCLFYWQYGSTSDYDAVVYEKQSGETVRLSYYRYIGGAQSARAYYELDMAPGTVYRCAAVWTDQYNGELGADPSLLRLYVDGVQGVDDNSIGPGTETYYFRNLSSTLSCGPGLRRQLTVAGGVRVTDALDSVGDTWEKEETTARTIGAGNWQVNLDYNCSAGATTNNVLVEVQRRDSNCNIQQTMLSDTVTVTTGVTGASISTATSNPGAVKFNAGDVLAVVLTQTSGSETIDLRFNYTAGSTSDTNLTHPESYLNHDDTEVATELWRGCAPGATGYRRAMNYVRNVKFWTRALSAEEV